VNAILAIAKTTYGEAMRKKVLNAFLLVALGIIVISLSFSSFGFQQDITIVKSFGLGILALAAILISVILGISLIPNEVERRTIYTILSKPVRRYEFITGKFLGAAATLFVNVALMGGVFIIAATIKSATATVTTSVAGVGSSTMKPQAFDPGLLVGVGMIYLQALLLLGVSVFFSVFVTPTVNFFMSGAVFVVGSFSASIGALITTPGRLSVPLKMLYKGIHTLLPNFGYYNIQNRIIHPDVQIRSMPVYVGEVVVYAVLYSLVLLLIGIFLFDRREFE
jgi:ABC-type transport system involved in multi-copper enzyme maturation permease subunit